MRFSQQKYIFHLSALRFKIIFQKNNTFMSSVASPPVSSFLSSVSSAHHVQVLGDEDQSSIKFNLAFLSSHHERAYLNSFCDATFSFDKEKLFIWWILVFVLLHLPSDKMAFAGARKAFSSRINREGPEGQESLCKLTSIKCEKYV